MEWLERGFHLVEQELGRDWIEKTRSRVLRYGERSLSATVNVAAIGWMVADTRTVDRVEFLREKIAKHDQSAVVELRGIHLLSRVLPGATIEYAPAVVRPDRLRIPDARVRASSGEWVYIEIAARHETEREVEISRAHKMVVSACGYGRPKGVNGHVRLNRPPRPEEIAWIREAISHGAVGTVQRRDLPGDLGDVVLDGTSPGQMRVLTRHGSEEVGGTEVRIPVGADSAGILIVSIRHSDHLIEKVVRDEGAQLPKDSPSLVLIHRSTATRGAATWLNRLRRYFASGRPHPSGAWLFQCDHFGVPTAGPSYRVAGTANPCAGVPLPEEVVQGMDGLTDTLAAAWAARFPDEL
jgi:hypothetical protein